MVSPSAATCKVLKVIVSLITSTAQVAVLPPSAVVTVIAAEPYPVAVSFPFSTATTAAFELCHITPVSVAFCGTTEAVSVLLSPYSIESCV